nr:hypothetical protein EVB34_073 [Rhizobium phage RHph_TM26]
MTGHFRAYEKANFRPETMALIAKANEIIEEFEEGGYSLTLRQLYYQFVSKDLIPNTQASYNKLGVIVNNGRMAGLISWTAIEDRGRNLKGLETFRHPNEALKSVHDNYRRDLWADQPWRPEVWVEKQALEGVVGGICNKLRVNFFAIKGYNSQSEQWRAGQRFARYVQKGQRPIVFHLGDHDPSGLDMTRDNRERLETFAGVPIMVQRLALNMNQIEELRPPPNPAKQTDSRFEEYRVQHGDSSWELDALDPKYIERLIENAIALIRDGEIWDKALMREVEERDQIALAMEMLGGQD